MSGWLTLKRSAAPMIGSPRTAQSRPVGGRLLLVIGALLAQCCIAAPTAGATGGYTITDLGTFGGTSAEAYAVNDNGLVVGEADLPNGDTHAFLYDGTLPITDLGTLGGTFSSARDVNIHDEVVGASDDAGSFTQAFSWTGGIFDPLTTDGGLALGVNSSGVVAGQFVAADGTRHAFGYDGSLTDIGALLTPLGGTLSGAGDVNASGEVVGAVSVGSGHERGFRWTLGSPDPPELLYPLGGEVSDATAVNDNGEVVGSSSTGGLGFHAVIWGSAGSITDLNGLGGTYASALAVNNAGQVVGDSTTASGDLHGFLSTGGQLTDLNAVLPAGSPWVIVLADDINTTGQIAATGYNGSEYHGLLLTPNTPAGANVVTHPVDQTSGTSPVTLTFANVTQGGGTTLATSASGPSPPGGFNLGDPPTYYELATTASFSGSVQVCIDATGITFNGPPGLWHYEGGSWVNVTTSVNGQIVCGSVTSLSPFALFAQPSAPTYQLCLLYDPGRAVKAGSTIPIKLQLCDANGANLSLPDVVLHSQGVKLVSTNAPGALQDSGNANPDNSFRYDATLGGTGGYIYNLSTKGLATGTYALEFTVGSASHVYRAQFEVR
jgi:probable HAF family extracellular repeat protein